MDSRRIVDVWMQHLSQAFPMHPMLNSLRRCGRGAIGADSGEVPISIRARRCVRELDFRAMRIVPWSGGDLRDGRSSTGQGEHDFRP